MSETAAAVAAEVTEAADEKVLVGKDAIYAMIGDHVKAVTGKRIGRSGGRVIFDMVVEQIFAEATRTGAFRFNGGFGSMHLKVYQAGTRRLPSGQETTFGERTKLRYEEGIVVSALVANKGDLVEAKKAKGTRTEDNGAEDSAAEATGEDQAAEAVELD